MKMTIRTSLGCVALISTVIVTLASRYQSPAPQAALGDIKYSILEPDRFKEQNGAGWRLLNGDKIDGTDLAKLTGITVLPDGRGVFIRGMNMKRERETGDDQGDRLVGSYQVDQFAAHKHEVAGKALEARGGTGFFGSGLKSDSNQEMNKGWVANFDTSTANPQAKETRPRNIALYVYIYVGRN